MAGETTKPHVHTRERVQRARAIGFAIGLLCGAVVGSLLSHLMAGESPTGPLLIEEAETARSLMMGSTFVMIPVCAVVGGLLGYFIGRRLVKRRPSSRHQPWG